MLNILYLPHNTKKIHVAYKSKHNLAREKQVILLKISNGENWHYFVVKYLPGLLKGIKKSNHKEENYEYCYVEMPNEETKIIKYNQGEKSKKLPFIICADLECLLGKMSTCYNNQEESSTTEINKHTPSDYPLFTNCSFDKTKNKLDYYRGKDCIKKFYKDLREHATKIINYEKKKMIPLTTKEEIYHNKQKICYICKKEFDTKDQNNKVGDHCHYTGKYRGAAHNICNLRYKIPKEIPIVFHNDSTYDYHFIIKELVKEFEANFECIEFIIICLKVKHYQIILIFFLLMILKRTIKLLKEYLKNE